MMILTFTFAISVCTSMCYAALTTVHSNVGTIVGFNDKVMLSGQESHLLKFLGIPYAESPTGDQRFKKPTPKATFNTPFHAKMMAPRCFEKNSDRASIASKNYTEDCLYLNIVVPSNVTNTSSLPVMVWIHGGGLARGSSLEYIPDALVAFGNIIVVTINYRLGVFGFLRSEDGSLVGNQGLWDQHMAIKWVHDNIDSFYGNPNEITIFGQSAGAESVSYHTTYGGSHGLFKRAIEESGTGFSYFTSDKHNAKHAFLIAGCIQSTIQGQIECLRSKSAEDLAVLSTKLITPVVVDGHFVTEQPKQITYGTKAISQKGRDVFSSVDLLIGFNTNEAAADILIQWNDVYGFKDINQFNISYQQLVDKMIPIAIREVFPHVKDNVTRKVLEEAIAFEYSPWGNPQDPEYGRKTVIRMSTDFTYFGPTVDTVRAHSSYKNARTYMYEFAMATSNHELSTPIWNVDANHMDEVPLVFGEPVSSVESYHGQGFKYTNDEQLASYATMSMWVNFAKTGNPNSPLDLSQYMNATWPEFDMKSQSYLKMASPFATTSVQTRLSPRKVEFWINYLPQLIHEIDNEASHFDPSTGLIG